jgi:hypothetical protein
MQKQWWEIDLQKYTYIAQQYPCALSVYHEHYEDQYSVSMTLLSLSYTSESLLPEEE